MGEHTKKPGYLVHEILAYSYLVYLTAVILGFFANMFYPMRFSFSSMYNLGILLLLLGTFLVVWAQRSAGSQSSKRNEGAELCIEDFCVGPYKITRTPTHFGLFLMVLGLTFFFGSVAMLVATLIAFVITRYIFIPLEEGQLEKKYGDVYRAYKKVVRF